MGDHIDTKTFRNTRTKKTNERLDPEAQRKQRVSFKSYISDLEEELLEQELEVQDEWCVEQFSTDTGESIQTLPISYVLESQALEEADLLNRLDSFGEMYRVIKLN